MWVFAAGAERSGSTVQFQVTKEIVETTKLGVGHGYCRPRSYVGNYIDDDLYHVCKTHQLFNEARDVLAVGKGKIVYIHRDPRDVAVSWMNSGFEFERVLVHIQANITRYHRWLGFDPLVSRYAETVGHLDVESQRIADYLGISLSPEEAKRIGEKFSIDNQKRRIEDLIKRHKMDKEKVMKQNLWDRNADPESQLKPGHIVSGAVGQWKTALTIQQVKEVENVAKDWMNELGYHLKFQ